ncbi:MAG: L-lactate permease [Proteobacteria bacterium]|nr:L-lactate permease [Pseudomonadota bacterium]
MHWIQSYTPVGGSLGWSALVATIPLVVIFICLAGLKMKAHKASLLAVASALIIAVFVWGMPAKLAGLAFGQGVTFGLFPVFYIVLTTLFLYNITVEGGQFEIIRASLAGLTTDRRIQALLIAFCFGAFIEGAAGFGTPVAIAGATLVGLGFRPLYAAGICLVANTAPVAFGAIGIPVVALSGVMGYDNAGMMKLSAMIGHQLPFLSVIIPLYVIVIMVGFKKAMEVFPAIAVCGITFALVQYATARFIGPYLPDITASLAAMIALVSLLRVWQPKENYVFAHEQQVSKEKHNYTGGQIFRAWMPFLLLMVMVMLWGIPSVKSSLDRSQVVFPISGLDNMIVKKVTTPDEGLQRIATVTGEIDKLAAVLPQSDVQGAKAVAVLGEIKALESDMAAVEQRLIGKGVVLPEERMTAFESIAKKAAELKKLGDGLTKDKLVEKNQFGAVNKALADQLPTPIPAKYPFNFMSAAGTAILIAALLSALVCGIGVGAVLKTAVKTIRDMRYPALTVAAVLGLAYIMNSSGMTNCLGLAFTKTGHWFPLISPLLGWLGVFLTGSDTSSNVLFGGLQKATAENLGINPVLTGAANSSGGVMGKMISPQSIAVATAACGMVGEEGTLFRFTLKHSLFLVALICVLVYLQANYLQWMIP